MHLVLSSTASQACVELAIDRFKEVRIDKIIFTKLDEAAHVGVVLNVVRKVNKQLSGEHRRGRTCSRDIVKSVMGRKLAQMILSARVSKMICHPTDRRVRASARMSVL